MKIDINQISSEGLSLVEEITALELDLAETETIKFPFPFKITADVYKVSSIVDVNLSWDTLMHITCSRCLSEFEIDFKRNIELNYPVDKTNPVIDLNSDIREEIILDYPMKPLCEPNCKGLCAKCGKNLNEGKCNC